jgi:hypothetical protein
MQKTMIIVGIALFLGSAGASLAAPNHSDAPQKVTMEEMQKRIEVLGYDVRRLRVRDGVFKADIVERQNGGAVRARFDLATGELIRAELAY